MRISLADAIPTGGGNDRRCCAVRLLDDDPAPYGEKCGCTAPVRVVCGWALARVRRNASVFHSGWGGDANVASGADNLRGTEWYQCGASRHDQEAVTWDADPRAGCVDLVGVQVRTRRGRVTQS